ncbi:MAG TPA: hypothetical protein VII51_00965 [Gaiellaceae bacterium]
MRVGFAAIVLVFVLAAAGCGGSSNSKKLRRQAATEYINRVNTVERQLRAPLLQIAKTYKSFSTRGAAMQGAAPRFASAEAALDTLGTRLGRIVAPVDAQPLRRSLLTFVGSERELAHELTMLVVFLPRFSAALQPLGSADKDLQAALSAIKVPTPTSVPTKKLKASRAAYQKAVAAAATGQAAALEAYIGAVAKVETRLRELRPPPAMAPAYQTQVLTLSRVVVSGKALVAALNAKKFAQVAALDRRFQLAATTSTSLTAQRAQIAAVKTYDARVRATQRLALKVDGARAQLQKTLG